MEEKFLKLVKLADVLNEKQDNVAGRQTEHIANRLITRK